MSPTVIIKKRCEWNRYCSYLAPFYSERFLEIGSNRPLLVGRCYNCEGFVCNRCAFRRPYDTTSETAFMDPCVLLCPLDGEPLGRGRDWIVFGGTEESIRRSAGPPDGALLYEAFTRGLVLVDDSPHAISIQQILENSFQSYGSGQYQATLKSLANLLVLQPEHVNSLLLRRAALEKLHQFDEAWENLRVLLRASRENLTRGLAELNSLKTIDQQIRDEFSNEILSRLKQAPPSREPALDALYKLAETFGSEPATAVRREAERTASGTAQKPATPSSASTAVVLESAIPQPQVEEVGSAPAPHIVKPERPVLREVVTTIPSNSLRQILSRLPDWSWTREHWTQFVFQCERGGAKFPGGCEEFVERVWNLPHGPQLAGDPLFAQLLVEFPETVRKSADLDLIALLELYATECFSRAARIQRCFGERGDPFLVPEWIAGEYFQTGTPSDVNTLARKLNEIGSADVGIEEWTGALRDYVANFPMLMDSELELGFAHISFEDFFLARHLFRNLFQKGKADFKLAGCKCFNQNTASFLGSYVMQSDERLQLLEEWLQMRRQRRSLFRGADVATFMRNLSLVRLMINNDAGALDLTDADFSSLNLDGADFSRANLTEANFRNASLRHACFSGSVLTGTAFEGADLTDSKMDRA